MIAAYLIDPARRGYPLDELTAEAGIAASVEGANGIAERAVVTRVLAERQRDAARGGRPHAALPRGGAAARGRAGGDGARRA